MDERPLLHLAPALAVGHERRGLGTGRIHLAPGAALRRSLAAGAGCLAGLERPNPGDFGPGWLAARADGGAGRLSPPVGAFCCPGQRYTAGLADPVLAL